MAFALAKVTWLALAVIALGPLLLGRGTPAEGDAGIVHIYLMLALTFPAGIGVVGLLALDHTWSWSRLDTPCRPAWPLN